MSSPYPAGFFTIFVISMYLAGIPATLAESRSDLIKSLQAKLANEQLRQSASLSGQDRALICSYCHGSDGNSVKPDVPNLAGQNAVYLLEQIGRFARSERKDFVMNSLAREFSEEDQINLAIFYSGKKVKPARVDGQVAIRGKQTYQKNCKTCHGVKGLGSNQYARLAGQKRHYIEMTLKRFRASANNEVDKKRRSKIMESIASQLSDQQIQNLAAYVASLK
ncbi:MAG: c-type cytochrome [Gammaproteobacteria bacterium]|nr:c-type cytochrome [Gammaproteobacteria bacterium]